MATPRSGAGGKIVTYRRKKLLSATPYDRPPSPKSPSWFAGVVVPSAIAIASGAGKILSSFFSESGTSSSEDEEECASEDDIVNDNFHDTPCYRGNTSNKKHVASSEMMHYRQESRLRVWSSVTKRIIEQLIMKETFSREECDRLVKVLYSRIIDRSMEAGENSVAGSPKNVDSLDKAIQEAKRWLEEKKARMSSVRELAHGTSNLNSGTLEHRETEVDSPANMAWSDMKSRPPQASPERNIELKTLLPMSVKLFQKETLHSTVQYSPSPSKNKRSVASGSWDIEEELQIVRSSDASHFAAAKTRIGSPGDSEEVFAMGERMTEPQPLRLYRPIDALVYAGVRSLSESRQAGKASEALLSKPDTSVSINNEVSEAVHADAEFTALKPIRPSSPNYAEGLHYDMILSNENCSPATEVSKSGGSATADVLSSSQLSLSTGRGMAKHGDKTWKHKADEKAVNMTSVEGNCEVNMEAPISMYSLCAQYEEGSVGIAEPFPKKKTFRKQQVRKPGKFNLKGMGRKPTKQNRKGLGCVVRMEGYQARYGNNLVRERNSVEEKTVEKEEQDREWKIIGNMRC